MRSAPGHVHRMHTPCEESAWYVHDALWDVRGGRQEPPREPIAGSRWQARDIDVRVQVFGMNVPPSGHLPKECSTLWQMDTLRKNQKNLANDHHTSSRAAVDISQTMVVQFSSLYSLRKSTQARNTQTQRRCVLDPQLTLTSHRDLRSSYPFYSICRHAYAMHMPRYPLSSGGDLRSPLA